MALVLASIVYLAAFLIGKKRPQKYLWLPFLLSVLIGAIVLAAAFVIWSQGNPEGQISLGLVIGSWIYRVAVLATLVSGGIAAAASLRKTS